MTGQRRWPLCSLVANEGILRWALTSAPSNLQSSPSKLLFVGIVFCGAFMFRNRAAVRVPGVVHVISTLERGGMEMRTLELFRALRGSIRPVVFQTSGDRGSLSQLFEEAGCEVVTLRFRSHAFAKALVKELSRADVTTLHLHVAQGRMYAGILLIAAALVGTPTRVAHFRSEGRAHERSSLKASAAELIGRLSIELFATDIIGVSPSSLSGGWKRLWEGDPRCRVIPSGIDVPLLERETAFSRTVLPVPDGVPVVLHVGRDVAAKNRMRAIEILGDARSSGHEFSLVFVGRDDPVSHAELLSSASSCGVSEHVFFLGQRSDLWALFKSCDAMLNTSFREGLPGAILEATAVGVPVVASSIPSNEYVSSFFESVRTVSLAEGNGVWIEELQRAYKRRRSITLAHALKQFSESPFSLSDASRAFLRLWSGGRAG
ncbi:glycosyltransferase [Dietzia maris]|uniref:Glycosyltransferase n=1 Tax=Dietzia maris TaxID=37915 RepID=A0AAE4QXQ7_9ACTN|nr:glycosyltransferase [Dietzia maris]MDV6298599.1 glycosyltransferase [Dietzia maris]